ncbi:MAG: ATP synthase A1 subunit C [Deltaproteobacteria bacterium]|nr:ATP synthase A1 subunit C [Deltaproteobacteria bacterium]
MDTNFLLVVLLLVLGFLLPFLIFVMRNLSNILPYLYAIARIRAKEARLLKPETLDEMINTGSVAEIASILENTEYALAMQGLVLDSAESIEDLLVRQTADVYSEIAKMLPDKVKSGFSFLSHQWDVRNLKVILRGVRKGLSAEQIAARLVSFGEMEMDLLKKMAESGSVEDVISLFEGTRYSEVAGLAGAYEQEPTLLPLEALLDRLLLEQMWFFVTSDAELAVLRPAFAARIDALNLKTMLRAKRDHLLYSDIEKYLIAGGELQDRLAGSFDEVDEIGALLVELEGTPYYKSLMDMLSEYEKTGSLFQLEKVLEETALAIGRDTAVKQPYGIAPMAGYLSLKDIEIKNIRAIVRAKEAGMAPEKIREFVLRV